MRGSLATDEPAPAAPLQLSPHFSLAELTRSATAARLGIDNRVPPELIGALFDLAALLERIRTRLWRASGWEVRVRVTSGYRCLQLNRAKASRDSSDHVRAAAADFIDADGRVPPAEICRHLAPVADELGIGQLALEYPRSPAPWVHVSTRRPADPINRLIVIHGPGQVEPWLPSEYA